MKKATSKKTVAITVLAVLLVALLAFNVTYAYFTDKTSSDVDMSFGIVDIQAGNDFAVTTAATRTSGKIYPGDTLKIAGTITATNSTDDMYVKIGILTGTENANIKLYYGDATAELKAGDKNAYYDAEAADGGEGYAYQESDITAMKSKVATVINGKIAAYINAIAEGADKVGVLGSNEGTFNDKKFNDNGIAKVSKDFELDLSASAYADLTLTASEFGNLFQNIRIELTVAIQAIQAANLTIAQAATAFDNANFTTGEFTL